jgi:hypothetical protein
MTSNSIERRLQRFASFSDIVHIRLHALLFAQLRHAQHYIRLSIPVLLAARSLPPML